MNFTSSQLASSFDPGSASVLPATLPRNQMRRAPMRCAWFVLLAVSLPLVAAAQAPPSGFPTRGGRPGMMDSRDPAEVAAYQAALSEPDADARVSALQSFLVNNPNSSLRQAALSQMLLAKRQAAERAAPPEPVTRTPAPVAATVSAPAPSVAQTNQPQRDSLLQKTAKPAEVTVVPHGLTIKADNSSLTQILHDISGSTGMKIDGLTKDERIFGNYGPADAREVLLALLEGSGYNVVMIGSDSSGAPRELSLSPRTTTATTASTPARSNSGEDADEEDEVQQVTPEAATPQPPQPQPASQPNEGAQQPRSPQEILQELQRLRQQNTGQPPQ